MADRTCATCGASVGILVDRCPQCGADPDLQLLELGVGSGKGRRPGPAGPEGDASGGRPRRRLTWRQWAPVVVALGAVWGVLVVSAGGDGDGDGDGTEQADDDERTTTTDRRQERTGPSRRGGRSTTTTLLGDGGPLLGEVTGWDLVVGADTAEVIDLDTGAVTRLGGGRALAIGPDGVLTLGRGGVSWRPAPFETGVETPVADVEAEQAWFGPGDSIWLSGYESNDFYAPFLFHVRRGEEPTRFDLPSGAWPWGSTDAGLVLAGPGGTYLLSPIGAIERISDGAPQGASADHVVVQECDEELRCGLVAIDLTDGSETPLDHIEPLHNGPMISVAPDGRIAYLARVARDSPIYLAVDGQPVLEVQDPYLSGVAWSPDGRWLAAVLSDGVTIIDTTGAHPEVHIPMNSSWMVGFVEDGAGV